MPPRHRQREPTDFVHGLAGAVAEDDGKTRAAVGMVEVGQPHIGLQILAAPFEEEMLLRIARMYEAATDWHTRRAKV